MNSIPSPYLSHAAAARCMHFAFHRAGAHDIPLVTTWLRSPHVARWLHGEGLRVVQEDLAASVRSGTVFDHWLASLHGVDCGYLLTSRLDASNPRYARWMVEDGYAISLDVFLGEARLCGMGIGTEMIRQFVDSRPDAITDVFIDPEAANHKAIHVYEKLGFRIVDGFVPPYNPVEHLLMWARLPLPAAAQPRPVDSSTHLA